MNRKGEKNYSPHPDEAWSWASAHIPFPIERTEKKNGTTWYYFRDENGDLFYQTGRGRKTALEMERAVQKHNKKSAGDETPAPAPRKVHST